MTDINTAGIVGIDGVVPIYDPSGLWKIWSISEIWQGTVGNRRYVPHVSDYVIDPLTYTMYIVDDIDPVTLIPTLREIRPANMSYSLAETDVLFGVGPGTPSDTYRCYLDKSTMPYILAVDARLKVAGTMCSYAKIFKGADISSNGVVVGRLYDNSGNFLSENIPLELVAIDSHVNYSIKTVSVCYTVLDLVDGELVTVVMYSDTGNVVSKRQLLVENTAFIRSINASQKYISSINLECPFISPTLDHDIEFPLNVPINALNMVGVVNYSDGTTLRLPVDGTKFAMLGIEQFVSTIVGQRVNLVLRYALSNNETAYGAVTSDSKYITEPYTITSINPNNSYTVKLFGYPVWINSSIGYQMRWWLFNLDRNVYYDVTNNVVFAENTGAYDPKKYGYLQRKSVTINLRDVSGSFIPFVHTQLVDIELMMPPDGRQTPWLVSNDSTGNQSLYGSGLMAILQPPIGSVIRIDSNIEIYEDWLRAVYEHTYPLYDRTRELAPPTPTHFEIIQGSNKISFTIDQWNKPLNLGFNPDIYSTIFIRFYRSTIISEMQLSMAAMIVTT